MEPPKGEITLLLAKWKDGDLSAFEELMPLVYPYLREVAAAYIRREPNPDVLHATALVHELYLRLLNQKKADWDDRQHFYTFAAKVMRVTRKTTLTGATASAEDFKGKKPTLTRIPETRNQPRNGESRSDPFATLCRPLATRALGDSRKQGYSQKFVPGTVWARPTVIAGIGRERGRFVLGDS